MLWDNQFLYVYAQLQEPHVWGTLTKKNSIIFHDNDFEVFIDPESSGENYYEFEMNALNTIWELTLVKRYTKGGPAILGTNLPGLMSAVRIDGSLNDPSDIDRSWSVEIAFPFKGWPPIAATEPARPCPVTNGGSISPALNGPTKSSTANTTRSKNPRTTGSGPRRELSTCTSRNTGALFILSRIKPG